MSVDETVAERDGLFATAIAMLRLIEPADKVIVMSPGLMPGMVLAMAVASASASAAVHVEMSPAMVIVVVMVFRVI